MKRVIIKKALTVSVLMALGSGPVIALVSDTTDIMMGHPPIGTLTVPLKTITGAELGASDKLRPTHTFEIVDSQNDEDGDARLEQQIYYQWVTPSNPGATEVTVNSGNWTPYTRNNKITVTSQQVGQHLVVKFTPKTVAGSYPDTGETVYWATVAKVNEDGKTYTPNGTRGVVEGTTIIPEQALTKVVPVMVPASGDSWNELKAKYSDLYTTGSANSPIVHATWKATYTCVSAIDVAICNDPTKYGHQWQYEDTPGNWKPIPNATSAEYKVAPEYQGKRLSVDVTPNKSFIDAVERAFRQLRIGNQ